MNASHMQVPHASAHAPRIIDQNAFFDEEDFLAPEGPPQLPENPTVHDYVNVARHKTVETWATTSTYVAEHWPSWVAFGREKWSQLRDQVAAGCGRRNAPGAVDPGHAVVGVSADEV